jgi:hypothetical protein
MDLQSQRVNNNNNNNNNGIINWPQEKFRKLDRNTRKLLIIHGQHHTKASADRLHVSRKYGGRGLIQLEEAYVIEITKLT